jgi:hypothetical protein
MWEILFTNVIVNQLFITNTCLFILTHYLLNIFIVIEANRCPLHHVPCYNSLECRGSYSWGCLHQIGFQVPQSTSHYFMCKSVYNICQMRRSWHCYFLYIYDERKLRFIDLSVKTCATNLDKNLKVTHISILPNMCQTSVCMRCI